MFPPKGFFGEHEGNFANSNFESLGLENATCIPLAFLGGVDEYLTSTNLPPFRKKPETTIDLMEKNQGYKFLFDKDSLLAFLIVIPNLELVVSMTQDLGYIYIYMYINMYILNIYIYIYMYTVYI